MHGVSRVVFWRRVPRPVAAGFVQRAVAQHCAGDARQAVGDRAQGAVVAVAASPQRAVLRFASGVALDRDTRPVLEHVAQPTVHGQAPRHDAHAPGLPGHRRRPAQAAQRLVVAPAEHVAGLREQGRRHARADAGDGARDGCLPVHGGHDPCLSLSLSLYRRSGRRLLTGHRSWRNCRGTGPTWVLSAHSRHEGRPVAAGSSARSVPSGRSTGKGTGAPLAVARSRPWWRPPSRQPAGEYQIDELQARSWMVAGRSGFGGIPSRRASQVDQRQLGFSSTRT